MIQQLQSLLERKVQQCVHDTENPFENINIKRRILSERNSEIVKAKASGKVLKQIDDGDFSKVLYRVHMQYLIKQHELYILEEEVETRKAIFYKNSLMSDDEVIQPKLDEEVGELLSDSHQDLTRQNYHYDRRRAVQYAERWWNDYNPQFKKFTDDRTNYISQCLYAGGAPMRGYPDRGKGWWMQNQNWSYSWSVAHSLRWYLGTSKVGLRAREVAKPQELQLGDVICYDFEGDGRFNHNTIVTGKDAYGQPLVNAHTTNSRMRYWSYEDSSAYTPNIQYKFFTIVDDQ